MRKSILQSEAAECGLACIAIVSDHFGAGVDMLELTRRYPLSLRGAKLSQLVEIAHEVGLTARAVKVDIADLSKLRTPCILHWDMKHFVVLAKAGKRGARIIDPAVGERKLAYAEIERRFTSSAVISAFVLGSDAPAPPAKALRAGH